MMLSKLFIGCVLHIGVFCSILPIGTEASHRVKKSMPNEMKHFAVELDNNPDLAHTEFKELLKPLLIARTPGSHGSSKVQKYIKEHFLKLNWVIEEDPFEDTTPIGVRKFNNIVVTHDPKKSKKLTLACHYDSKSLRAPDGREFIGATDSAVPCAILMDLASKLDCYLGGKRVSKDYDDYTVQLLFLDGEEAYKQWTDTDSLYGSRHLTQIWNTAPDSADPTKTRLASISLFVLLDLIGTQDVIFRNYFGSTSASSSKYFQHLSKIEKELKDSNLLNSYGVYSNSNGRPMTLFPHHVYNGEIQDDHKPFMEKRRDLTVLHLIPSPFPRVWHEMSDTENSLDYDVTNNVIRVLRLFVANYMGITMFSCGKP